MGASALDAHPIDRAANGAQIALSRSPFAIARDAQGDRRCGDDRADARPRPSPSAAGQFNMLYAFGLGEVAISISGDPAEQGRIVHTVRAVGAVSAAITRLRRGMVIGVRGPYGSAWPVAESEGSDIVIVAGGLGLAPLRPVIYRVLARRERYGRVVVLYGARGPADILYPARARRLAAAPRCRHRRHGRSCRAGLARQCRRRPGVDPTHCRWIRTMPWRWCAGRRS